MNKIHKDSDSIMDLNYEDIFGIIKKKTNYEETKSVKYYIGKQDVIDVKHVEESKERKYVLITVLAVGCFVFTFNVVARYLFAALNIEVDFFDKINSTASFWVGIILGRYFGKNRD